MENTSLPPEPPPIRPEDDQPTVEPAPTMVMPKNMSKKSFFFVFVLLPILIIAVVVPAVMKSQTITGQAAVPKCRLITKVMINPGKIDTYTGYPPTNLSVLAYDYYNNPITEGVQYEWGMSSSDSIGTVKANHDLASFIPIRPGTGDLYVKTKNKCTVTPVIGSIKVTVQLGIPSPTVKPRR